MTMRAALLVPTALAAALSCSPALAGIERVLGDTGASAGFNRPLESLAGLSVVGTDVRHDSFSFSVTAGGLYTISSFAIGAWDNFLVLYADGFDASAGLTNAIAASDDFLGRTGWSRLSLSLDTGTVYTLVTTGFGNEDFGRYVNSFRGAGSITSPVPEPAPAALLLAGLGVLAWAARRRRA